MKSKQNWDNLTKDQKEHLNDIGVSLFGNELMVACSGCGQKIKTEIRLFKTSGSYGYNYYCGKSPNCRP